MKKQRMTWLLCSMLAWLVSSCMVEEEMYRGSSYGYSPYVKTGDVSEISRNSAVVKGALDIENLTGYHEYGILWSINYNSGELEYDGTRTPVIGEGNNPSSFQVELTDLNSMTTYYYCTYVEMPDGPIYGRVKNFVTLPAETPKLMFPEAFGKDDSGFSVRSAFENWDGQSSFETGFCWKKVGSDYTEPTLESCDRLEYCDSTTPFQTRVDVYWSEASLYAVRAFVRLYATDEIVYSPTLYVSQDDNPLLSPCIVEAIDGNTVSFHAMACNFDRLAITEKGFCYSETSSAPTIEANTKVSDITSEEITEITATIEGLNPDQFYYVRAYCVADGMTYYGPTYIYGKRDAGIYTLEDLVAFRDARNNNEDVSMWKNEEGVINLYSDIDMGSIENWIPIKSIEYGETFNGNKHTLDNMKITAFEADYNSSNLGFIEYNNGTIKDLYIGSGSSIMLELASDVYTEIGVGFICVENEQNGSLEGCSSAATISVKSTSNNETLIVGGLVGKNYGKVINCIHSGLVDARSIHSHMGGVISYSGYGSEVSGCVNEGSVGKGYQCESVAGIAARINETLIVSCQNKGEVTANAATEYMGGICGYCDINSNLGIYASIDQCTNEGNLKGGKTYVGGIAGDIHGGVTNCINTAAIVTEAKYAGTICGRIWGTNQFAGNQNTGTINGIEGVLNGDDNRVPLVSIATIGNVTATTAELSAQILDIGGKAITSKGFFYSTNKDSWGDRVYSSAEGNLISLTLENLVPDTTYFIRTFANNDAGEHVAGFVSFTTPLE